MHIKVETKRHVIYGRRVQITNRTKFEPHKSDNFNEQ